MAQQEDQKTEKDSQNLYQKLAAISGEVGSIPKGGKNAEQHYSFIEYAAVAGQLRTLFAKYSVVCLPTMGERSETEITTKNGAKGYHVLISFKFTFINGDAPDEREVIDWIGEATDYGDKATNKAATAALKYCLMRTFNISEKGDEDADASSPEGGESGETRRMVASSSNVATDNQRKLIFKKLNEAGVAKEDMSGYLTEQFGVDPENMNVEDASAVIAALIGGGNE